MDTYIYWAKLQTHWYSHSVAKQIICEIENFLIFKKCMPSIIIIVF